MSTSTCEYCGIDLSVPEMAAGCCRECADQLPGSKPAAQPTPYPNAEGLRSFRPLEEEDRPVPWATGRTAVGMLFTSICLVLGAVPLWGLGAVMARPAPPLALLFLGAAGLLLLTAGVLYLIALIMLCTVPSQSGARPLAFGILACDVLHVLLPVALVVVIASASRSGSSRAESLVMALALGVAALHALLWIVRLVCYSFFFRAVARYYGDSGLGRTFMAYLLTAVIGPVVLVVLNVVAGVFVASVGRTAPELAVALVGFLGLGALGFGLGMVIWLLCLLARVKSLLEAAPAPRARSRWELDRYARVA